MDFVRLSALENRMGELKVRPGQFGYHNSTHFRTRTSTKNIKMWSFWGLINHPAPIKIWENSWNRLKIPSESCDDFRIDFKFAAVFSKKKDREPRAPPERGEADSRFVAWRFSKSSWKTLRIPQLHVKWSFDDVLIFRCVPLFENDPKIFWYDELFYPKSHTLAGSVSELSHTEEIFLTWIYVKK